MKKIVFYTNKNSIPSYFIYPILRSRRHLLNLGYDVKIIYNISNLFTQRFDTICLLSNPTIHCVHEKEFVFGENGPIISLLKKIKKLCNKIIWLDDSDSTTMTHFEVLPFVDIYLKKQLLKDRELYREEFYGGRIFTNFYHNKYYIEDDDLLGNIIKLEKEFDHKVFVSWNIGLGDLKNSFNFIGRIKKQFPYLYNLNSSVKFTSPFTFREIDFFLRTSSNLRRNTVSFHRKKNLEVLKEILNLNKSYSAIIDDVIKISNSKISNVLNIKNNKINNHQYKVICKNTKIMPSPFGWGEIGVRDYEAFINGSLLFKPNIDHMETWPNLFIADNTFIDYKWDFSDLPDKLFKLINNNELRFKIARNGQDLYKKSISSKGMKEFCKRFIKIIGSI